MLIASFFKDIFNKSKKEIKQKHDVFSVFYKVKDRFIYASDKLVWDKLEHWESEKEIPNDGLFKGDCDSFALAIRKHLKLKNINNSRLIFCQVNGKRYHLVVEWNGWILDNRFDYPMTQNELPDYDFLKISGYNKGDKWRCIV